MSKDGKFNKSSIQSSDYSRNALSMVLINYQGDHSELFRSEFSKLKPPSKFDDHTLDLKLISEIVPCDGYTSGSSKGKLKDAILNVLLMNRVGNKIISKWFNQQPDGSFNMELIKNRGIYNATDLNVVNAASNRKGEDLIKDSGEKLLKNSYILVMGYPIIKTMEEVYNEDRTPYKDRHYKGWMGNYDAYLFRLNWNDSIASVFYNSYWINSDDSPQMKRERKEKFEKQVYSLNFVSHSSGAIQGTTSKENTLYSDAVLFNNFLEDAINKAEYGLSTQNESFQVNTSVFKTKPIGAKIGEKEGLRIDDRYFVYENIQKRNGEIKSKRKAVVRAKKIIYNTTNATGNSNKVSTFYQIAGRRVDEGMLLKQKNDKGFGISPIYSIGLDGAPGGYGAEIEHLSRLSPGLKAIGGVTFDENNYFTYDPYSRYSSSKDVSFTRYYIGVRKSLYFARNYQLEPAIRLGFENSSELPGKYGAYYFEPNVQLGANIIYKLQLTANIGYYYFLNVTDFEFKDAIGYEGVAWTDLYPGRSGISFDFGLRFQF